MKAAISAGQEKMEATLSAWAPWGTQQGDPKDMPRHTSDKDAGRRHAAGAWEKWVEDARVEYLERTG
jgi:uncharacterized cupin superfamily protein